MSATDKAILGTQKIDVASAGATNNDFIVTDSSTWDAAALNAYPTAAGVLGYMATATNLCYGSAKGGLYKVAGSTC